MVVLMRIRVRVHTNIIGEKNRIFPKKIITVGYAKNNIFFFFFCYADDRSKNQTSRNSPQLRKGHTSQ